MIERTQELTAALSQAEAAELAARKANAELARLATTDALTGLANRRMFDAALDAEWLDARSHGGPLTLLIVDVDHFKACNDTYGHAVGDDRSAFDSRLPAAEPALSEGPAFPDRRRTVRRPLAEHRRR